MGKCVSINIHRPIMVYVASVCPVTKGQWPTGGTSVYDYFLDKRIRWEDNRSRW